jgi:hypothetical protein
MFRVSSNFDITGITYNSVALTKITKVLTNNYDGGGVCGYTQLWYLVAPTTGANTVSVAFTRTSPEVLDAIECGSVSFTGVDQTTPYQNLATTYGSGTTPSIAVTSSTGNAVVDSVANGASITSSGQTNRWLKNVNSNSAGGNGAQSTAAGAASVTMSYSVTSDWWGIIGVDVKASGGSAAAVTGTATASITESDVVTGGKVLTITLTGDTFIA